MEYILTSEQMRECDANSIEGFQIPSLILMERAALGLVRVLLEEGYDLSNTLVVCGVGNNGGDGLAAARILTEYGFLPVCVLAGPEEKCTRETRAQLSILNKMGIRVDNKIPDSEYTTIIDALFGIGLSRPAEGGYKELVDRMNAFGARIVSADIPSGVHADSGKVLGAAVRASLTVTFAYKKRGLCLYPGADYAGKVIRVPIGIPAKALVKTPEFTCYGDQEYLKLPERPARSNKGTFGKALLIAGSRNMAGAACLAGSAVLRTGAGMLMIHTPEENRVILQQSLPEALLSVYDGNHPDKEELKRSLSWARVVGIGPGLSEKGAALAVLAQLMELLKEEAQEGRRIPVLIDADGLNLLSGHMEWLDTVSQPVILTPHPVEMARLLKCSAGEITEDIPGTAGSFSKEHGVVCVLKDARTVTADPSGRLHINLNGNSGMATAGSGDVLSGIILGLLAQGEEPYDAARKGVFLHGEAGDLAAEKKSEYGITARDLAEQLPAVMLRHGRRKQEDA